MASLSNPLLEAGLKAQSHAAPEDGVAVQQRCVLHSPPCICRGTSCARRFCAVALFTSVFTFCVIGFAQVPVNDVADIGLTVDSAAGAVNFTELVSKNSMLCATFNLEFRWMWADASIIGHRFAKLDPLRWSSWQQAPDVVRELTAYQTSSRPVEMQMHGCGTKVTRVFPSAAGAIENLDGNFASMLCPTSKLRDRWMWGDASVIGHWAAEFDPFRWSSWKSIQAVSRELRGFMDKVRPVEIEMRGCGGTFTRSYGSVIEAMQNLDGGRAYSRLPFEFNSNVSTKLAYVSAATYEDPDTCQTEVSEWTCELCKKSGLTVESGSVRRFFAEDHAIYGFVLKLRGAEPFAGSCLVAFRGTSSSSNYFTDLDELQAEAPDDWNCPSCYVHSGFLAAWNAIEMKIVAALRSAGCTNRRVILTGHSLGGALATLGAWPLKNKHGFELKMIYTYESPRVGTGKFAAAWDADIGSTVPSFRITSANDAITNMPCFWGAFRHVRYEVAYAKDGSFSIMPYQEAACEETSFVSSLLVGRFDKHHCQVSYISDVDLCADTLRKC